MRRARRGGSGHPDLLDTLAAAHAEAGHFGEAVETVHAALALLASAGGSEELAAKLEERLRLCETGQPSRQQPSP